MKKKKNLHKYRIVYNYSIYLMLLIVGSLIFDLFKYRHSDFNELILILGFWLFFIAMIVFLTYLKKKTADSYDKLFEMRKNPMAYKFYKELLETRFNESNGRFSRLMFFIFLIMFVTVVNATSIEFIGDVWQSIQFNFLLLICIVDTYAKYIFDFDEPPKKEKKEKEELTILEMLNWKRVCDSVT